ncbi:hypothetical protein HY950_02600 [Candidatus Gottesmanbacteria bacterium]|nr:hypothetical protein [Candidatus Gottesmanbacteria bacterium]
MKTKTINISLSQGLYDEAKRHQREYHYSALSELIRDALRWWLNPRLTRNGFTPEFERSVLKAAAEPIEDSVEWDGKGSFVDFVLKHPVTRHGKRSIRKTVQKRSSRFDHPSSDDQERGRAVHPVV